MMIVKAIAITSLPYRLDIYELLNRTSSRIVRVPAASGLAVKKDESEAACNECTVVYIVKVDLFHICSVNGPFHVLLR